MKYDILGIGEVCVDWVAIVDHFPAPDEKIDSISQNLFSGGVTANYIVAAARLGAKAGFFGAIGKDSHGLFLKDDFINEKVDTSYLCEKNSPSPVNFIFVVKETGEKVIIQSPYMYSTIPELEDLSDQMILDSKVIHTTAIYPEISKKAFQIAKKNGVKISLDLEKQIVTRGKNYLNDLLKYVDLLIPNKAGAMQLMNTDSPKKAAQNFLDWGIKTVVITLGADGAVALTKDEEIHIPAFKAPVVDTTGAGDTFCAAFDYSHLILNQNLEYCLKFSNAASALKIQKLGARTGMPTFQEVENFLKQNQM
jgi:ribokinase